MGAGQIGGIATLLDIDFNNAAGFLGEPAQVTEGQFMVYYLSHAMMFCVGALIEAHVVLTPASCVYGERYKFSVFAGAHKFLENAGTSRVVEHLCIHKGYNHTMRWLSCTPDNLALLVLNHQFSFHKREEGTEFVINRVRYGASSNIRNRVGDPSCRYYGWGSRRNGYLIPLLIDLHRMDVAILPSDQCLQMWNYDNKYLCLQQPPCKIDLRKRRRMVFILREPIKQIHAGEAAGGEMCLCRTRDLTRCEARAGRQRKLTKDTLTPTPKITIILLACHQSEKYGALCPDDLGAVLVCSGYAQGLMTSRLIDRPCGVGFLDLSKYIKFLTCGVDDSRDVIDHDDFMTFEESTKNVPSTPSVMTADSTSETTIAIEE